MEEGRSINMLKLVRFLFVPIALLLVSCAGFPKPASGSDTLAIGSFIVDFPDGFYGGSPRTIDWPIKLEIMNSSTSEAFKVITKPGGYFYFVTNGRDTFVLKSCSYNLETGSGSYSGGANLSYKITVDPGCVQYLGHFKVTNSDMHQVTDENSRRTWTTKLSWSQENKKSEAKQYLQDNAQDTPWLTYEIHPAGD